MSYKDLSDLKKNLIHLGILIGTVGLLVTIVFYIWLPIITSHGETITVPDIKGMTINELKEFMSKRNLRFDITADSSYSPNSPPLTVLRQIPFANTKVKENRKIYVALNAKNPPMVIFPDLIDRSLKSTQMILKSYDLKLGEIKYIPDPIAFGTVHEAQINGRTVLEGEKIEKGSVVNLIVGDGTGNTIFETPNLIGLDYEEAKFTIIGSGLKVGKISIIDEFLIDFFVSDSVNIRTSKYKNIVSGTIQKQYPKSEKIVKIGDPVDIWIYKPDSLNDKPTILDNQ